MPHRDTSVAIKQALKQSQTKGDGPQPVYQNRERLLSRSKQYRVPISTEVYFFSLD